MATMGAPSASIRCPACGATLRATLAPSPATQWFPCPRCHTPVPFVPPRALPPLYSWEVVPGLYPLQGVPRRPRWRMRSVAAVALAAAAVLSAVAAGLLGSAGYVGALPAQFVVSGTVYDSAVGGPRVIGAHVVLYTDDNRSSMSTTTGVNGGFSFADVPAGGIEVNITDPPRFAPTVIYTFATRSYSSGTSGLAVALQPGGPNNTSEYLLSPYPDLTTFLAYVGAGAVLLGGAAATAAVATVAVRRPGHAVAGVVGSGAALAVPVVMVLFALATAFPTVAIVAGAAGGVGAFGLVITTTDLAIGGPARPAA
jgi:hypothetical protein